MPSDFVAKLPNVIVLRQSIGEGKLLAHHPTVDPGLVVVQGYEVYLPKKDPAVITLASAGYAHVYSLMGLNVKDAQHLMAMVSCHPSLQNGGL